MALLRGAKRRTQAEVRAALRSNPERAEMFDAKHGRGASQKIFNNFPITILTTP